MLTAPPWLPASLYSAPIAFTGLTLNVFTPAGSTAAATASKATPAAQAQDGNVGQTEHGTLGAARQATPRGKAVMVWVHGGCYGYGTSGSPEYDGSVYAATQDVVVVTLNYRLGAFGWLGHDALRSRDPVHGSTGN